MKKIRNIIFLVLISTLLCSCTDFASDVFSYIEGNEKMYRALVHINEQEFIEAVNEGADPDKFEKSHNGTYSPLVYAVNNIEGEAAQRFIETILSYDIDPNMTDPCIFDLWYKIVFEKVLYDNTDSSAQPSMHFCRRSIWINTVQELLMI